MFRTIASKVFRNLKPRSKKHGALPVEVSACIPSLEVLGKQIVSVAETGNSSVENIGQSFAEMATKANELVSQVADNQQDECGIGKVQQVLALLLSKFQDSNEATLSTSQTLALIEEELSHVETCSSEVERIAKQARLVSFNGRIEAERAGVDGTGFGVVAEETGKLALAITKSSQEIGTAVSRLTATLQSTTEAIQRMVETGGQAAEECERDVQETLSELISYQHQLEQNLESARSTGDHLSNSISRSIVSLQFQDAASQRMMHVSNALEKMRCHFEELAPETRQSKLRSQQWLDEISSNYCVAEEHMVHAGEATESSVEDMSNVELF